MSLWCKTLYFHRFIDLVLPGVQGDPRSYLRTFLRCSYYCMLCPLCMRVIHVYPLVDAVVIVHMLCDTPPRLPPARARTCHHNPLPLWARRFTFARNRRSCDWFRGRGAVRCGVARSTRRQGDGVGVALSARRGGARLRYQGLQVRTGCLVIFVFMV